MASKPSRPVIVVSGQPGSGKTTIARGLAQRLGIEHLSSGRLFREYAARLGMDIVEFHRYAEEHLEIDREIDEYVRSRALEGGIVIDSHVALWLLRDITHVAIYVKAPLEVRARRIAERDGISLEDAERELREREESNRRRYMQLYGIDISDISKADLVIDTSIIGPDEAIDVSYRFCVYVLSRLGLLST